MQVTAEQLSRRLEHLAELESHLTFRISRLAKLLEIHSAAELSGTGLNLTWYRILLVLSIFEETTAADLSRVMVLDRAQISRASGDLLKQGLLKARPDPRSKLKKLLSLTPEGQAALDRVVDRFTARQERLEGLMSDETLAGLSSAIDTLSAYLADTLHHPEATPVTMTDR